MALYHVKCPLSGKTFSFVKLDVMRRFVLAIMRKNPKCTKKIRIMNGRQLAGTMWKVGDVVLWKTNGVRERRIVNEDGSIRRN